MADEWLIVIIVTAVIILSIAMTVEEANVIVCNDDYCTYDFNKRLYKKILS